MDFKDQVKLLGERVKVKFLGLSVVFKKPTFIEISLGLLPFSKQFS